MDTSNNIEFLSNKYLTEELTDKELGKLLDLLQDKNNIKIFKSIVKDDFLLKVDGKKFDYKDSLSKIQGELNINSNNPKVIPLYRKLLKYASIVLVFLALGGAWYFNNRNVEVTPTILNNVEIVLSDGSQYIIDSEDVVTNVVDNENNILGHINKGALSYKNSAKSELAYNTLKVPYGRKFQLVLSDGTKVDVNSGTSLKYPVTFIEGEKREVFLITGEAYFDVTKNEASPFVVNADGVGVTVLGTQFNVASYAEDSSTEVTLEEGSVVVYNDAETSKLKLVPNERSVWSKTNHVLSKSEVNTGLYTSWRKGKLIFSKNTFKEIAKILERHFGVTIEGYGDVLAKERFTARFEGETINQIMLYFKNSYGFDYQIKGNKIIINSK